LILFSLTNFHCDRYVAPATSRHSRSKAVAARGRISTHPLKGDTKRVWQVPGSGAVAFEVVLASKSTLRSLNARNDARAFSYACRECENVALAYQFVVSDDVEPKLTDAQKAQISSIRQRVLKLEKAHVSQLVSLADELANELLAVLQQPASNQRSIAPSARVVTLDKKVSTS
jgi:hypothetical protein